MGSLWPYDRQISQITGLQANLGLMQQSHLLEISCGVPLRVRQRACFFQSRVCGCIVTVILIWMGGRGGGCGAQLAHRILHIVYVQAC